LVVWLVVDTAGVDTVYDSVVFLSYGRTVVWTTVVSKVDEGLVAVYWTTSCSMRRYVRDVCRVAGHFAEGLRWFAATRHEGVEWMPLMFGLIG
jgi:hypothetical protein